MKKMLSFTIFFSFIFLAGFNLAGFNDLALEKDKKGDFSFRKYTNCKIND